MSQDFCELLQYIGLMLHRSGCIRVRLHQWQQNDLGHLSACHRSHRTARYRTGSATDEPAPARTRFVQGSVAASTSTKGSHWLREAAARRLFHRLFKHLGHTICIPPQRLRANSDRRCRRSARGFAKPASTGPHEPRRGVLAWWVRR